MPFYSLFIAAEAIYMLFTKNTNNVLN